MKVILENIIKKMAYLSMISNSENTRRPRASFYSYVKEYSEYSTIAGFVYIFMDGQTIFGKLFWASTIVSMISLGMYWISVIYLVN